jgi:pre-60S factor REI1
MLTCAALGPPGMEGSNLDDVGCRENAFVCSTSKDTFTERKALAEHYRSELHRYNLKRKVAGVLLGMNGNCMFSSPGLQFAEMNHVHALWASAAQLIVLSRNSSRAIDAGLPPVTAEWFDARREQLKSLQAQAQSHADKVFVCPITNKRFQSEATYYNHTRTKKFSVALKNSGLTAAPSPKIIVKKQLGSEAGESQEAITNLQHMTLQPTASRPARLGGTCEHSDDDSDSGWQTDDSVEDANGVGVCSLME